MIISGITIQIVIKAEAGTDEFGAPIYEETTEDVENVLVGEPSTDDRTETFNLTGKYAAYTLAIPKGDTHDWVNTKVILPEPFKGTYRTIGYPTAGIEAMIPLSWNKKVQVERYGEDED